MTQKMGKSDIGLETGHLQELDDSKLEATATSVSVDNLSKPETPFAETIVNPTLDFYIIITGLASLKASRAVISFCRLPARDPTPMYLLHSI